MEWAVDPYARDLKNSSADGHTPEKRIGNDWRALRGGNFFDHAGHARSAARTGDAPYVTDPFIGFRLVRIPKE
jgi:formylglycine-generating enzyme required for sulfatase activity